MGKKCGSGATMPGRTYRPRRVVPRRQYDVSMTGTGSPYSGPDLLARYHPLFAPRTTAPSRRRGLVTTTGSTVGIPVGAEEHAATIASAVPGTRYRVLGTQYLI